MSNEATRANALAQPPGTPGATIDWAYTAPSVINVYFAPGGLSVSAYGDNFTTSAWDPKEVAAAKLAFQNFANVANVKFNYVNNPALADFMMIESAGQGEVSGSLGYWGIGGGHVQVGAAGYILDGYGVFNAAHDSWTYANLAVGGYGYVTLIHEIGHGMGLAHPHDNGGGSEIMHGVSGPFNDYGDFDLNQGIWTTMSYNDGWATAPHVSWGPGTYGYGWQGTLMALDISVLQDKYGANLNYRRGNDVYILSDKNAPGTYYAAIWDAGGNDSIRYDGTKSTVINMTAATLKYAANGGGVVSYVTGIHGGFTIANGVVIENAIGGSGKDKLIGNSANNILNGRGGADAMYGLRGNDTYYVDHANDLVDELKGDGVDNVRSYISFDLSGPRARGAIEKLTLLGTAQSGTGNDLNNTILGNAAGNILNGKVGKDNMMGMAGNDLYYVDNAGDLVNETNGSGVDTVRSTINFSITGTRVLGAVENLQIYGNAISATGNNLANKIVGNAKNNIITGGGRADTLTGLAGADTFDFNAITESGVGAGRCDIIADFSQAQRDKIDLSTIDAVSGTAKNDAFNFLSGEGAAFTGVSGQLRFDQTLVGSTKITLIEGDLNGNRIADFQIQLNGWINLIGSGVANDFIL